MTRKVNLSNTKRSGNIKSRTKIAAKNKVRRKTTKRKTKKTKFVKKLSKVLMVFVGIGILTVVIAAALGVSFLNRITAELPSPDQPFKTPPTPSVIYDRKAINEGQGVELYKVIGETNSDPVNIDEIPEYVKWAFLAAEDADFYTHYGYDVAGIVRCASIYVRNSVFYGGAGEICGGSTITQQLVKTTILSSEVSLERKITELFVATRVEQEYEKDTILQMYLQVAPFGSNVVGIETAANYYFRKDPSELTLGEAAALAAIVQSPASLSPTKPLSGDTEASQEALKERQTYVLGQMEVYMNQINEQTRRNKSNPEMEDILTTEIIEEARNQELEYSTPIATDKKAGHFVDFVISELVAENSTYKNGEPFTIDELQNGGYRIYTTLDYSLQQVAESTIKDAPATVELGVYGTNLGGDRINMHNAALMTMIPSTGEIVTMAGSLDFNGESKGCDENNTNCLFNGEVNILNTLQSPGSTNKSLAYYMAFENGTLGPGSNLPDIPIQIGNYEPKNWNDQFVGPKLTAREALRQSRNIPAIVALELVGVQNYLDTSINWGYTSYTGQYGHSVVLGGGTVYPVEHAQAYAVLANGGNFVQYETILKIEDKEGNVVYEHNPEVRTVANPQAVFLLNQVLYNLNDGRFNISWDGRPIAGKTGTSEASIDNWLLVYSPDFVTLGWAGNNNNSPMDPVYGYPTFTVTPWLRDYMSQIGDTEYFAARSNFPTPAYVYQSAGCDENGRNCANSEGADWLIQAKSPPSYLGTTTVEVCTDQQDKLARPIDKALGFSKTIQTTSYVMPVEAWQSFLDDYLAKEGIVNGNISGECTIDRTGGSAGPIVKLTSPLNYSEVGDGLITVQGNAFSTSGSIRAINVSVNGVQIGSVSSPGESFSESFNINDYVSNADEQSLSITVVDSSNNSSTTSLVLLEDASTAPEPSGFVSIIIPKTQFTYGTDLGNGIVTSIEARFTGFDLIDNVVLHQVNGNTGEDIIVGNMSRVGGSDVFVTEWGGNIEAGVSQYIIYAVGSADNRVVSSGGNKVITILN